MPEIVVFTAVLFESLQQAKLSMCEITTFSANYKDNVLKLNRALLFHHAILHRDLLL